MKNTTLFRTKLVSLNPDEYELRSINKLSKAYNHYREAYVKQYGNTKNIKAFKEWRLTEI